ncbi:hypothetical protein C0Z18_10925 [Trinickia dabaoshanensis]|uniref:Uncharacterized protein n=1 Tax=Trinickia dabaoshanensis TaxID=564714 RepID=A0A2N7VTH4_9BURK|nr:hypothetical protein C0Z18_10925 [Trinickia dabaoshanensis]
MGNLVDSLICSNLRASNVRRSSLESAASAGADHISRSSTSASNDLPCALRSAKPSKYGVVCLNDELGTRAATDRASP